MEITEKPIGGWVNNMGIVEEIKKFLDQESEGVKSYKKIDTEVFKKKCGIDIADFWLEKDNFIKAIMPGICLLNFNWKKRLMSIGFRDNCEYYIAADVESKNALLKELKREEYINRSLPLMISISIFLVILCFI